MIFSVREAARYYDEAYAKAWTIIAQKLEAEKRRLNLSEVRLESIAYDADSYISQIDELPNEPKAPSLDELEVKVGIEAVYRIIR